MTDLYVPRRIRGRFLRLLAVVIVAALAAGGGWAFGRRTGSPVMPSASQTPAPPWQAPPQAAGSSPIDATGTWVLPQGLATLRTTAGVPYGWPDTDEGAVAAAVTAVKAGMWFKYTLGDPWGQLGFLAADQGQTDGRKARVAAFLTPAAQQTTGGRTLTASGPCRCGVAIVAAAPGQQVSKDQGFMTVNVTAATLTTDDAGVRMSTAVVAVLLHWEGDWKLADVSVNPLAVAGNLPAGAPLPAPSWEA